MVIYGVQQQYSTLGTGQSTCWDMSGTVINCSTSTTYPGMDGNVYGTSYKHAWSTTTNTALDLNTGLRWQRADNGTYSLNWQQALQYCNNLNGAGIDGYTTGWRLPNKKEILDIWDDSTGACNTVFSRCGNSWSSTSNANFLAYGYYFGAQYGLIAHDSKVGISISARCVRFEN